MKRPRTALVFGATGLIGSYVVEQLCADDRYDCVRVFARRSVPTACHKVEVIVTNFEDISTTADSIVGTDLFMCLGTTLRAAGSQERQRFIDQQLPLDIAALAHKNGVANYLFVSSIGANASSKNFYARIKGETEQRLHDYPFVRRVLLRPSMLLGPRKETRLAESIGKVLVVLLKPFLLGKLKRYRGIHAKTVAQAMIAIANSSDIKSVYESEEITAVAKAAT